MRISTQLAATLAITIGLFAAPGSHRAEAAGPKIDPNKVFKSDTVTSALEATRAVVACAPGFFREGSFMCITSGRGPNSFANAALDCKDLSSNVAGYTEWRYRVFRGDGVQAPVGWWLGGITADNTALFVNSTNLADFDGETSRFESRSYACAYYTK